MKYKTLDKHIPTNSPAITDTPITQEELAAWYWDAYHVAKAYIMRSGMLKAGMDAEGICWDAVAKAYERFLLNKNLRDGEPATPLRRSGNPKSVFIRRVKWYVQNTIFRWHDNLTYGETVNIVHDPDGIEKMDLSIDIENAIQSLPERWRLVAYGVMAGRTDKEIALEVGVTTAAIQKQRHRVMKRLRPLLAGYEHTGLSQSDGNTSSD